LSDKTAQDLRQRATLFDSDAERYDRSRPAYPDDLMEQVLGPASVGLFVLDVASGTGIASRQMADRGARVLGVELNPGMADVAERHGIPTDVSDFESWDPKGRTFDRVTCAQAWHWLDHEISVEKAVSVLRPGGRLCLFWSVGHHPDDLAEALRVAYEKILPPGSPRLVIGYAANNSRDRTSDFTVVADALESCDALSEPRIHYYPWTRTYSREQWLDQLLSHGDHAALLPDVREQLFKEIGETVDCFGGGFDMTYETILISASRR
jgi:SAM-dependent methyltransferase